MLDGEIDGKRQVCGKCYKLDRRRQLCERHMAVLYPLGFGQFEKCEACKDGMKKEAKDAREI